MNAIPKPRRERDEQRLAWIRTQPCLLLNRYSVLGHECTASVDAHHVREKGKGGAGTKPSDFRTVPLCRNAHDCYHAWGKTEFERMFGLNLEAEIKRLNQEYAKLHPSPRRRTLKPRLIAKEVKDLKSAKAEIQRLNRELEQLRKEVV